jgi:hypothetical protein
VRVFDLNFLNLQRRLDDLNEKTAHTNLKKAFDVSDAEGIPRVVEINDILQKGFHIVS